MKLPLPIRLLKERYFGARHNPWVVKGRIQELSQKFSADTASVIASSATALIDYQDPDYALLYLDRLDRYIGSFDDALMREVARRLSSLMQYEDPTSVAHVALSKAGFTRSELGAEPSPDSKAFRLAELLLILPAQAADPVSSALNSLRWSNRTLTFHFKASSTESHRWLKLVASLKFARRYSKRFTDECALIERWLHMIEGIHEKYPAAAIEVARTSDLIVGSGLRYFDGVQKWHAIVDELIKPLCRGSLTVGDPAGAIRHAYQDALDRLNRCSEFIST